VTAAVIVALAVVVLIGIVVAAVATIGRTGAAEALSGRLVLLGYLHFASVVSSLVIAFGLVSLVTAALTLPAGREFSYSIGIPRPAAVARPPGVPAPPEGAEEEIRRQNEARAETQFRDDLVRGVTLTVVGLLIWALHSAGLRALETATERRGSWLSRLHRLVLLAVFGAAGLVALPLATYELARYVILGREDFNPTPPGNAVATAVVIVPIWLYELWQTIRLYRGAGAESATDEEPAT
jgi:hypothetical protein